VSTSTTTRATGTRARRGRRRGGAFVVLLALVLFGGAYAVVQPNQSANAQAPEAADIQAGRSLFVSAGCVTCHGLNADGVKDKGPTLIGVGAASVDFQVGTGRMPLAQPGQQAARRAKVFSDAEISQLAAYVASLAPGPAIPSADQYSTSNLTDADMAEGGELFRTNCAGCHNFAGKGGALPDGRDAPPLTDTESVHMYEAMLTGPGQMPVFADTTITQADKQKIIAYLDHVRTADNPGGSALGSLGPVTEGLWGWIAGIGSLVLIAVWLAARGVRAK
jgi:ubiquinol-cytochrome c reductase cytochrome c subunit